MRRKSTTAVRTITMSVMPDHVQVTSSCWQIQAVAPTAVIAAKKQNWAMPSQHDPAAIRVTQAVAKAATWRPIHPMRAHSERASMRFPSEILFLSRIVWGRYGRHQFLIAGWSRRDRGGLDNAPKRAVCQVRWEYVGAAVLHERSGRWNTT